MKAVQIKQGEIQVGAVQISQKDLDSSCWLIQFWGIDACKTCEYVDTPNCGGNIGGKHNA